MHFDFFSQKLKILHVDDDEDDFIIMRDLLEHIEDLSFDLEWVGTYDSALETLLQNGHDLCLLDYYLGQHNGLELFEQAQAGGCQIPFVMLTGTGNRSIDWKAMKRGIRFYVDKNSVDAYELERAIRYTLEHVSMLEKIQSLNELLEKHVEERTKLLVEAKEELEVQLAEQEREVSELGKARNERISQTLRNISQTLKARVTADLLGIRPLKQSAPDIFSRFVTRYEVIFDLALERRAYKIEENIVSDELRAFADEMGSLQLSPRDVVEIYNHALKRKSVSTDIPSKLDAYIEEGRLTLLELMGYLVTYYRNLVSSGTRKET